MIRALRRLVYRLGFRPKRGSLLYSSTAAWWYAAQDRSVTRESHRDGGE